MRATLLAALISLVACAKTTSAPAKPDPSQASSDSGSSAGAAPPTLTINDPLGEPLSFAFLSGFHNDEQVWLLGEDGALLRISTWDVTAETTECGNGWSTSGYTTGSGRFGRLHFDAEGKHLLFTERLGCIPHARARVLAHELASGTTSVLLETDGRPQIIGDDETTIVVVSHTQQMFPERPLRVNGIDLFELVDGALRRIEPVTGTDWLHIEAADGALVARLQGRTLLLVSGISPLERVDGTWRHATGFAPLDGGAIESLTVSPSGQRLCIPTSVIKPEGGRDSLAWVLDPDGTWSSVALESTASCFFSPDESRVALGDAMYELDGALSRVEGPALPYASASWRGALYGSSGGDLSRTGWSTLTTETVLAQSSVPALCDPTFGGEGSLIPYFPPDDRPLVLGKLSCGCIDCDVSGSLAWNADDDGVETIEPAWAEHDVYGFAWLPDGGAVVLSTQSSGSGSGSGEASEAPTMPAAGTYFHITPDGTVETVGPLPDVEGVMHGPVSYPASLSSPW